MKRNIGVIVGATVGISVFLSSLFLGIPFIRRSRSRLRKETRIDVYDLKHTPIDTSPHPPAQRFLSDRKLLIPSGEIDVGNSEEPTGLEPRSSSPSAASRSRSSLSGVNSSTPSVTTTARQQRLQEQEQASISQLSSLEAMIGSSEWVSRAEYNAMVAEISRLRAEVS